MPTIRVRKDKNNPYVMLNKSFLNDRNLSFKAKGLLAYLLSKPDDWIVYEGELAKASADGRHSVRAAIKELIEFGYMERERTRDEKGLLRQMECNVHEVPRTEAPAEKDPEDLLVEVFQGLSKVEITPEEIENIKKQARSSQARMKSKAKWKMG